MPHLVVGMSRTSTVPLSTKRLAHGLGVISMMLHCWVAVAAEPVVSAVDAAQFPQPIVDDWQGSNPGAGAQQAIPPSTTVSTQWLDQLVNRLDQQDVEIRQ
jgi:hypothetical protein